jgi:hypothetical protein
MPHGASEHQCVRSVPADVPCSSDAALFTPIRRQGGGSLEPTAPARERGRPALRDAQSSGLPSYAGGRIGAFKNTMR